jgi:hypothetical protein
VTDSTPSPNKPIRWWPGILLTLAGFIVVAWVRAQDEWPFQKRNLAIAQIVIITGILLLVWWTFLSRAPNRLRLGITFGCVGLAVLGAALFRIRGMSGDLLPIIEFRWAKPPEFQTASVGRTNLVTTATDSRPDFPQYLGLNRDGVLAGPKLETNWTRAPTGSSLAPKGRRGLVGLRYRWCGLPYSGTAWRRRMRCCL